MNLVEAITVFSSYSQDEKAEFLAQLIYELTVVARDNYEVDGDGLTNPHRMRLINEVQHRLSAFLHQLLSDDPRRYPDDLLIRTLLEHPSDEVLGQHVAEAFARAHRLTIAVSLS